MKHVFSWLLLVPVLGVGQYPTYDVPTTTMTERASTVEGKFQVEYTRGWENLPNHEMVAQAFEAIEGQYAFEEALTAEAKQKLLEGAVAGMVAALEDPHSSFIPPHKTKSFTDDLEGAYEGIGAYMEEQNGQIVITAPIKGSPAERAGLEAGDVLLRVNGQDIFGMDVYGVVELVRGPVGSSVEVLIQRDEEVLPYAVTRGEIVIPPVTFQRKQGVPVLGLHQFTTDSASAVRDALSANLGAGYSGPIIIDVRNNPGGFLQSGVDTAGLFLPAGATLSTFSYRNGDQIETAITDGLFRQVGPIVVLQNEGTASAAEILIGALLEHHSDVVLVGAPTYGKGTIQSYAPIGNGALLKLTTAMWYTPEGRTVRDNPFLPHVPIAPGADSSTDMAMKYAINYINTTNEE